MEFNILNEKNEFKLGTIIASLEVAYLNKDKDGYNYIEEIDDDKVLKEAMKVVKKVILLGEQ